jgi:integrase
MYSEGKPSAYDWEKRAKALIIPQLGSIEVKDITSDQIREWRDKLAASPARIRTRSGEKQKYKPTPSTEDEVRQRKVSTNRTLTILKAALNLAFKDRKKKIPSDIEWRTVSPFEDVEAARTRFLTLAEAKRLINSSSPEFRPVVRAALMTGARYGEMAKLKVKDFHRDGGTIFVERSKNKRPRHIILTDEGVAFFQSLTKGRANPDEPMFLKKTGTAWRMSHQARPLAKACRNARIFPPVSFHQLRHTYASLSIMKGMTLMVLAGNLGHSDTRMVEKHYGHLADDYKRKMIRETAPKFGIDEPDNVTEIS